MNTLSHFDAEGKPKMVDVGDKTPEKRVAKAKGFIHLTPKTLDLLNSNSLPKGDALVTARLAGIQAAKKTSDLIPLCHPLRLTKIDVTCEIMNDGIEVHSEVACVERTGVEMEALTAVSVALLTIYDMCKAVDKNMLIGGIKLIEKTKTPMDAGN